MDIFLGIDIGGTTGRVCAYGGLRDTTELDRVEFSVSQSPQGDFEQDYTNLRLACGKLAGRLGRIAGIGIALAGKVDAVRSMLTAAGNIGHWVGQPITALLSEEYDCGVGLGNDAEAAAMAEAIFGHGQQDDFLYVIWGTGVGGCFVRHINGTAVPLAGELGHQQVDPHGELLCGCGQRGCLEAHCGGMSIFNRFGKTAKGLSPLEWTDVVEWMTIGVHNAVTIQPVSRVIFGGGVAIKQPDHIEEIHRMLGGKLRIVDAPHVQLSHFGEGAGTVGALALIPLG